MITRKADACDYLVKFFQFVKTQFRTSVKILQTDNGKEFLSQKLTQFLDTHGCIHQTNCNYTPQQNGIVERKHRDLLEVCQGIEILVFSYICLLEECVLTTAYIINQLPLVVLKIEHHVRYFLEVN